MFRYAASKSEVNLSVQQACLGLELLYQDFGSGKTVYISPNNILQSNAPKFFFIVDTLSCPPYIYFGKALSCQSSALLSYSSMHGCGPDVV